MGNGLVINSSFSISVLLLICHKVNPALYPPPPPQKKKKQKKKTNKQKNKNTYIIWLENSRPLRIDNGQFRVASTKPLANIFARLIQPYVSTVGGLLWSSNVHDSTGNCGQLNIKITSYQCRNFHHKGKNVSGPSYLYNEKPHRWDGFYIERGPWSSYGWTDVATVLSAILQMLSLHNRKSRLNFIWLCNCNWYHYFKEESGVK